jgi:hypothetical protein
LWTELAFLLFSKKETSVEFHEGVIGGREAEDGTRILFGCTRKETTMLKMMGLERQNWKIPKENEL